MPGRDNSSLLFLFSFLFFWRRTQDTNIRVSKSYHRMGSTWALGFIFFFSSIFGVLSSPFFSFLSFVLGVRRSGMWLVIRCCPGCSFLPSRLVWPAVGLKGKPYTAGKERSWHVFFSLLSRRDDDEVLSPSALPFMATVRGSAAVEARLERDGPVLPHRSNHAQLFIIPQPLQRATPRRIADLPALTHLSPHC